MGVVRVTYLLSMAEIPSGSSFEPNNPREICFMSFEHDELDGKYSLISCRDTCVLLCMMLSCLAQTLECCFSFSSAVSLLSSAIRSDGYRLYGGWEPSGRPTVGVTAEQLAQLLGAVKDGMREELSSLK